MVISMNLRQETGTVIQKKLWKTLEEMSKMICGFIKTCFMQNLLNYTNLIL